MAVLTGFGTGAPIITFGADAAAVNVASAFKVTAADVSLVKVRFWVPSDSTGVLTGWEWALYGASGAGGAVAPILTQGVFGEATRGAWIESTLAVPYVLTSGVVYYATVSIAGSIYGYSSAKFLTGPVTNAELELVQSSAQYLNGVYAYGGLQPPGETFNATWYGVDVSVSVPEPDVTPPVVETPVVVAATGGNWNSLLSVIESARGLHEANQTRNDGLCPVCSNRLDVGPAGRSCPWGDYLDVR